MVSAAALDREAMTVFEELLAVPDAEREQWLDTRTRGRPDLRTRVTALLEADRNTAVRTGGAMQSLQAEATPERIGAYRIISLIGRGGMGAVYLAERDAGDFSRTVAIKVIKAGLFSPELVRRFQSERQTLATLAHPNIATLYDGGETEAGSPYIVMEYVDGAPLLQWANEAKRSRDDRLKLFSDICSAVAFAHSRLIVHRDLSPANVLVTKDGVAKLIDFGIAKPTDDGVTAADQATAQMTVTPGYTAPERLLSRQVTTAADVYSLGKLLHDLAAPRRGDAELRAIVARATADDPRERYPSVEALAVDIAAFRSRRPVQAFSQRRRYQLRKFVSRHVLAVTSSLLAVGLLVTALVLTLNANVQAEHARLEAEARFQETRGIAKMMLFDVFDEVSATAGSTQARAMLAETGLAYLEALAADEDAPNDVRLEAGLGFLRLSQVVGGGQASELGRYQDAQALLVRAEEIITPLYAANPDDRAIIRAMAQLTLEQAGGLLYGENDPIAARAAAARAQALIQPIATSSVDDARLFSVSLQTQGDTHNWNSEYELALPFHQQAEAFATSLPAELRDSIPVMRARAANLRLTGDAHHNLGHVEEARAALEQAVALNRAVRDSAPNNPAYIRNVAVSTWFSAVVHRTNRRDELARASIQEAVANAQLLRERDPNDAGALRMLAIVNEVYAQVLADLERYDESYVVGEQVIAAHRDLVQRSGDAPGAQRSLAAALLTHGGNSYNAASYSRACQAWIEAQTLLRAMQAAGNLADGDRTRMLGAVEGYVTNACNPPRAGTLDLD